MNTSIFGPMVGLVALTMAVWAVALRRRVREIRERRIPLQSLAHARDVAARLNDCQAMDNFNNLLQMPVLFYAACLVWAQIGSAGGLVVAGAWLYVVLRTLHSAIQVTTNKVLYRFQAWMASNAVLFALWAGIAVRLVTPA